ncbi:hypothetical protein [Sphingomonas sp. BE137]|uniref:hypothetical protein n=1 Tax=Sphingomonas sp. BE137 TaxID=2817844 RepID=UPI001AE5B4CB|nr:hypothetical protein [Sphingomonas sp. BE137]MDR6847183.1 hypothetical protein [Sphingomonas sp. BE137]
MRMIVGLAIATALSGCATMDKAIVGFSPDEMFARLDRGLEGLKGHPAQGALDTLGYPDQQMVVAGDTVYTWRNEEFLTGANARPLNCVVKVAVRDGIVTTATFNGNAKACLTYANRFPA